MAFRTIALMLAVTAAVGTATPAFAQAEEAPTPEQQREPLPAEGAIRADLIRSFPEVEIADLPGGHWATHATQVAVANRVLRLEHDNFNGERMLTSTELHQGLQALAVMAENIAAKGLLTEVRTAVDAVPDGEEPVSRGMLAQALARLLDAADQHGLVALAEPSATTTRFLDLGPEPPPAIRTVVDTYKVMTGFKDMTFQPRTPVTRYQFAAVATHILEGMRRTPIAQRPIAPPEVVMAPPPPQPEAPTIRPNFRNGAPITLSWQALNATNLVNAGQGISVVPVSTTLTAHAGPLMVQGIGNYRYDVFAANLLDGELRLGYNGLKAGMFQLIPYVGAGAGLGVVTPGQTQFTTYYGASYGGILSVMPWDAVELWGSLGQSALLGGGRFNQAAQITGALTGTGTYLTNYGLGVDMYVMPNVALTLGLNNFQLPSDLHVAQTGFSGSVTDTLGGNVGLGFSF